MAQVILKCVKEGPKLRIKFHCYINENGVIYNNAYNNEYNCKFPKDIRVENKYYSIGCNDIELTDNGGKCFYNIKKKNIKIIDFDNEEKKDIVVFDANECVICMEKATEVIFVPCGHKCACRGCSDKLKKECPLCRRVIISRINNI